MIHGGELPLLLRAAYFGMHRVSDAHFASHGVTADQFVVLARLAEQRDGEIGDSHAWIRDERLVERVEHQRVAVPVRRLAQRRLTRRQR